MSTTPNWSLFAAALVVAVAFLLVAARASERLLLGSETGRAGEGISPGDRTADVPPDDAGGNRTALDPTDSEADDAEWEDPDPISGRDRGISSLSTEELLLNAGLSQALLGAVVVAAIWFSAVPLSTLGLDGDLTLTIVTGLGLGFGLAAANEVTAGLAERLGIDHDERLRQLLAPDSVRGWVILLVLVLPLVAGVEELLFRGAIIGALSVGFDLSPWGLAVISSVLFGLGHSAQGRGGVAVTAGLGFVLAAAFIATGSLVVVIVAHYLVNALEFIVHEGLGLDPV